MLKSMIMGLVGLATMAAVVSFAVAADERFDRAGEQLKSGANDAGRGIKGGADATGDKMSGAAKDTRDYAHKSGKKASKKAKRAKKDLTE